MTKQTPDQPGRLNLVWVANQQRAFQVDTELLADAVDAVLGLQGVEGREVSIALVSKARMAGLNQEYRGGHGATDVLSFSLDDPLAPEMLGEVVVCLEVIHRQAGKHWDDGRPSTQTDGEELALMVIHSLLHLLGHDHKGKNDTKRMVEQENLLFSQLSPRFPPVERKAPKQH